MQSTVAKLWDVFAKETLFPRGLSVCARSQAESNADKQMGFEYAPRCVNTKMSKCLFEK